MKNSWEIKLAAALIAASAVVYAFHYLLFHDLHHIMLYLVGDIAFVFIEVLMVSIVIHRVLSEREKKKLLGKLNMVIGAFYSEVGTELLAYISDGDARISEVRKGLLVASDWTEEDFMEAGRRLREHRFDAVVDRSNLLYLRGFLIKKRDFMVRLLENQALLEHESFTDLLWSVFHLTEELSTRKDINTIPASDVEHLAKDVTRAYCLLAQEWFSYMMHLKDNYPYLYSLAVRQNPFSEKKQGPEVVA